MRELEHSIVCSRVENLIVTKVLNSKSGKKISKSDNLIRSGIIDSLGIFVLVGNLEPEFSIRIGPEEVSQDNFTSIDKIAAFVASKLDGGA